MIQDSWNNLQRANLGLRKPDRMALTPGRVAHLQDSYQAAGGAQNVSPQERLQLDRRAFAQASLDWVAAHGPRLEAGLASCAARPDSVSCQDGQAMKALAEAARTFLAD